MYKVSIIIAVYNAGEHLKRCVDSILCQTLKEIQIVLVIDCPTDGSDNLVKEYADSDARILIVENHFNMHIGLSRNEGLKVAKGEYVAFADHDDFLESNSLEDLYFFAKNNDADVVFSPISKWYLDDDIKKCPEIKMLPPTNCKEYAINQIVGDLGSNKDNLRFYQVHGSLYKRELIEQNCIRFVDTRIIVPEDVLFNIEALVRASKVMFLNEFLYYHVQTGENTGNNLLYYNWEKRCNGIEYLRKFFLDNDLMLEYGNQLDLFVVSNLSFVLLQFASRQKYKVLLDSICMARKNTFIKKSFRNSKSVFVPHKHICSILSFFIRL